LLAQNLCEETEADYLQNKGLRKLDSNCILEVDIGSSKWYQWGKLIPSVITLTSVELI